MVAPTDEIENLEKRLAALERRQLSEAQVACASAGQRGATVLVEFVAVQPDPVRQHGRFVQQADAVESSGVLMMMVALWHASSSVYGGCL